MEITRRYAAEMIEALDTAHGSGVVHRDLKPANVMITASGAKLLDFGIAKMIAHDGSGATTADVYGTRQGSVIGTAAYMSPEQARGQAVDKRADIWAFGCVLFEMLSGRPVFARDTVSDTLAGVLEREPEWSLVPAATPPSLVRLTRRCLQKDPSRRLRDIADARADIEDLDAGAAESRAVARPLRLAGALPWMVAAAAILFAATVILIQSRRDVVSPPPLRLSVVPPEGTTWVPFDISGAPQFALSPDARQIALVVADTTRIPRLWVRTLDSSTGRPLTGTDNASGPFWSPDGSAIAFFAERKLKKILVESGSVQELAEVAQNVAGGSWSGDGTILFRGPAGGLLRVSANGGPVAPVTTVNAEGGELFHAWPQFLPDGRRFLLYVRHRDPAASGTYVRSLDSRGPAAGARVRRPCSAGAHRPSAVRAGRQPDGAGV